MAQGSGEEHSFAVRQPGARPDMPPQVPLPPLREDLRLYTGPTSRDGSPSWRVLDPVRNAFFQIGWLEFELLARWKEHRSAESLIAQVAVETTLRPTLEEAKELIEFLAANLLLAPTSALASQTLAMRRRTADKTWYQQLLHHYLFFRIPLFRPDAFLARTVGLTDIFFTRGFVLLIAVLLGLDLYLLSREWYSFTDAMGRILAPRSFAYYAIAVTLSKVVHELAHAYASRRYGVRVPTMGVAFLVLWPYLYTDTGETWKLSDHRKQLVIACAGIAAELSLAVLSTLLWALSPEGAAKHIFFVLASTTWIMTLAINVSPFMRFDGYFVLSDLLDFPNLHERAGVCAKWWLRRTFFGIEQPMPEPQLRRSQRAGLIVFAYVTWAYRLTVFIGIALLVYHFAFKLLGIFLMLVEIVWFILKPIWAEAVYVWKARHAARFAARPVITVLAVTTALVWLFPVSTQVIAPAVLRANQEYAVYAPFAGRITEIRVHDRQAVTTDSELVKLEPLDLRARETKADIAVASARAELARMPASRLQQENYRVLQERLAQALSEKQAVLEQSARQIVRASTPGTIRDLPPDLVVGRWVNPRQLLMRVVSHSGQLIEAYVGERQISAIQPGQIVRFYPRLPDRPVVSGEVVAVDKSPQKELARPILASAYGGDIAVKRDPRGQLVAQDAVFRVLVKPVEEVPDADSVISGSVRIQTDLRFLVENFVYRTLSVLIREAGL